mgnify:CR=1 FL=1
MKNNPITFYSRFEQDILSGLKTITIRNFDESDYEVGVVMNAATYKDNRHFAKLKLLSITPIHFDDLNEIHAKQENMTLLELKNIISDIYPNQKQLFVLQFELA